MNENIKGISNKRMSYYVDLLKNVNEEIEELREGLRNRTTNEQHRLLILNSEKRWLEELITNQDYLENSIMASQNSITNRDRIIFEMMQSKKGHEKLLSLSRQESKKDKKYTVINEVILPRRSFPLLSYELSKFNFSDGKLLLEDQDLGKVTKLYGAISDAYNEEVIINFSLLPYEKLTILLNMKGNDYTENLQIFSEFSYFIDTFSYNMYRKLLRRLNNLQSKKFSFLHSDEIGETKELLNELTDEIRSDLIRKIENIFDEYRKYFGKVYSGETNLYEIVKNRQLFSADVRRVNSILKELKTAINNVKVKVVYDENEQKKNNEELSNEVSKTLGHEVTGFNLDGVSQYNIANIYKNIYLVNAFNSAVDYERGYSLIKK